MDPLAEEENLKNYDKLITALEASSGILNLLIAICDRLDIRDQIIDRYESEVSSVLKPIRIRLDPQEPSLRMAVVRQAQIDPEIETEGSVVLTVTGTEVLLSLSQGSDRSEQDKFLGYLQWTREGMRQFHCPLVLWVSESLANKIAKDAPDFWSWRGGVFRFKATTEFESSGSLEPSLGMTQPEEYQGLSVDQLIPLIDKIRDQEGDKSPLLASLYQSLGQAYTSRFRYRKEEKELGIQAFRLAINLQEELGLKSDLVLSYINLGRFQLDLWQNVEEVKKAEACLRKALELAREVEDRSGEATALLNLGNVYNSLAQYTRAIESYGQSLAIRQDIGDRKGVASSLLGLGNGYWSQGQYEQAIELYEQSLSISQQIADQQGEANSLGGLGTAHISLGEYKRAIELYEQSLAVKREIGDLRGEAILLQNLAVANLRLGRIHEGVALSQQSTQIMNELGIRLVT